MAQLPFGDKKEEEDIDVENIPKPYKPSYLSPPSVNNDNFSQIAINANYQGLCLFVNYIVFIVFLSCF